jgi:hypothetical protein
MTALVIVVWAVQMVLRYAFPRISRPSGKKEPCAHLHPAHHVRIKEEHHIPEKEYLL